MFKELHNKLGEKGQALTVLSLLEGPDFVGSEDLSGSLRDVTQRLRDMAGGDEAELVSMYSVYPNEGGSLEFLALELVPLRQAIQRINQINGGSDDTRTVLRVLDGSEEEQEWEASENAGPGAGSGSEGDGPVGQAMIHLRDAMRSLFNRAGERGETLTVLSLLSEPNPEHSPEE